MSFNRREILTSLGLTLIAAPAIVRASSIMPVRAWVEVPKPFSIPFFLTNVQMHHNVAENGADEYSLFLQVQEPGPDWNVERRVFQTAKAASDYLFKRTNGVLRIPPIMASGGGYWFQPVPGCEPVVTL